MLFLRILLLFFGFTLLTFSITLKQNSQKIEAVFEICKIPRITYLFISGEDEIQRDAKKKCDFDSYITPPSPVVSPNGNWKLEKAGQWVTEKKGDTWYQDIYKVNLRTGQRTNLTNQQNTLCLTEYQMISVGDGWRWDRDCANSYTPKSINDDWIIFYSNRHSTTYRDTYALYAMRHDGSQLHWVLNPVIHQCVGLGFQWSQDKTHLIVTCRQDSTLTVFLVNPNGSKVKEIFQTALDTSYYGGYSLFSLSQHKVLLLATLIPEIDHPSLLIYFIHNGKLRLVYQENAYGYRMSISPDEKWILLATQPTNDPLRGKLSLLELKGDSVELKATYHLPFIDVSNFASWSKDSQKLRLRGDPRHYILDIQQKTLKKLTYSEDENLRWFSQDFPKLRQPILIGIAISAILIGLFIKSPISVLRGK